MSEKMPVLQNINTGGCKFNSTVSKPCMQFESISKGFSLREKIGQTCQIHGADLKSLNKSSLKTYFDCNPVGSIFLGSEIIGSEGGAMEKLKQLISDCQVATKIPLSIAGDLENGAGGAIRGLTAFPNLLALGALNDESAAYDYGRWTAIEACEIGFNWAFGPVVDLIINWLNPIVSIRSLGQSPERVARLASALIRGFQENGLSATAKHFPGDGVDFRDQHFCVSVNSMSEDRWWQTFGRVYEACFQAGVHSVMAGHIALPWLEPEVGTGRAPLPATTSGRILTNLLRDRMKYDGVIVSDALIMAGFRGKGHSREDLIIEAFNAGVDVMLWPGSDYFDIMERALKTGRISEKRLNCSVNRVLAMKAKQINAISGTRLDISSVSFPNNGAARLAQTVADGSLTLVENQRNLLPMDPQKVKSIQILLATPREEGHHKRLAPLLEGLANRGIRANVHVNGNCLDLYRKEQAGEKFDALIAIFELWTHGFKNTMRPTGPMAECMWTIQHVETMHPIIISLGPPFLLHDMPWAETYINAYSSNPHTLRAIERALFGELPFRGLSPIDVCASWVMPEGIPGEFGCLHY